jgi:monofunctional biosynthetic peptidoglycan transglycosylase
MKNMFEKLSFLLKPLYFIRKVCLITGYFFWFTIGILAISLIIILNSLPDIDSMKFEDFKSLAQKKVIYKINVKKPYHRWVSIDNINRGLLWAVVISEDSTFFKHNGINFDAMYNAFADNLKRKKIVYGASTITQQVAKNIFLTSDKNYIRKIKEYFLTKSIEKRFSKNQILEVYLNIAEFGPNIYGVHKSSGYYFKKKPKNINAAEGCFMALFLPSPRKYHHSIYNNRYIGKRHRRKIRRILRDMSYMDFISPVQFKQFVKYKYFK